MYYLKHLKVIGILFLSLILISNKLICQNDFSDQQIKSTYHECFTKAKEIYFTSPDSIFIIDSLIQVALAESVTPLSTDLYFLLKVFAYRCDEKNFCNVASQLINNGVSRVDIIKIRPSCISKRKIKTFLKQKINTNNNQNVVLKETLDQIQRDDKYSQFFLVSNKKREQINNNNFEKIRIIVKQLNKWPGISVTGRDQNINHRDISDGFVHSLLHFTTDQIEFLLPFLEDALKNNDISPYHYARIFDYYYIKKTTIATMGRKPEQYYGIYRSRNGKSVFPVNMDRVKKRRVAICLSADFINFD